MALLRRKKPRVIFSSQYTVGLSAMSDAAFEVQKFKRIRDELVEARLVKPKHFLYPEPCSYDDIRLAHTEKYVKHIQDPVFVNQALRVNVNSIWENTILEYFRAATGGTILAAFYACMHGKNVFNLAGGFHHAHADKAEGFCLINDVAIAIKKIQKKDENKRVLVIDLDYHQGNGNALIFRNDPRVYTFSIHADNWVDVDCRSNTDILVPSEISNRKYLELIKKEVPDVLGDFEPDLIFFIAGSDPYEYDTLADMKISRSAMLERNMFIYRLSRNYNIPMAVLPAGGYGPNSWEVYFDFIKEALQNG